MARIDTLGNFLTDVANSIRNKKGSVDSIPASNFDTEIESIETGSTPILQNKSITITENGTQNITYDKGYDGLNSVEVTTNVPSGGDVPEKGFIVKSWNSNGGAENITIVGMAYVPSYAFASYNSTYVHLLNSIVNVTLPNTCTRIMEHAFYNCRSLQSINIPNGMTSISDYAFTGCTALTSMQLNNTSITGISDNCFNACSKLTTVSLPDTCTTIGTRAFYTCSKLENIDISKCTTIGAYAFSGCSTLGEISLPLVTTIGEYCFQNCTNLSIKSLPNLEKFGSYGAKVFSGCKNLKQLSMPKITGLRANANQYSTFGVSGLIAVWIGSPVTQYGISNSTFYNATNVKKIFIDLPRETVEAMNNYSTAFSNNTLTTDVIICNDDSDFMTCEEFDAIDWSTYTG